MDLKYGKSQRGFGWVEFEDRYGVTCTIQNSSLATEEAIWFGPNEPNPRVLRHGRWEPVTLPEGTLCDTRMHLTRETVAELLPILQRFVKEGEI